jgi:YebC/PmpR family DNA-binding regulatory protein
MGAQWKHKGRVENAAAKGKLLSKAAKEVLIAAKSGADPSANARLRLAIEFAKKAQMTRDTLERLIKKGSGQLDEQVTYESVTYEGFAPHQVPVIVECLTDNRTRTAANVRTLFRKGQLAASGAVSWDFARLGAIDAKGPAGADPEAVAIDAGAQDLEPGDEGVTHFYTEPGDLDSVRKALEAGGWTVESAALVWRAKNPVTLDAAQRPEVEAFLAEMDEDDDVQTIFVGLK